MMLDANGNPVYYLSDGMGSVIGLANAAGAEVGDFRYDSFGNVREEWGGAIGSAGGDFRFQGQWLESDTGIYHFRARNYDAQTGTFLSRDPIDPTEQQPEALNSYQFAYNNPYVYSDPSGMFTLMDVNASQSIQNILQQQGYNAVRQELINQAQGVVTNLLVSTAQNLVTSFLPGSEFAGAVDNILNRIATGGTTWERILTDALCDLLLGSYRQYAQNLWLQARVTRAGVPTRDGFNCGEITYTLRGRVISTAGQGGSGPRPDFLIKEGGPASTDYANPALSNGRKAFLIGDVKATWDTVEREIGRGQGQAILNYARFSNHHQYVPAALYVTAIGGSETTHQEIVRKGLQQGVYTYILTLFPFIRRR